MYLRSSSAAQGNQLSAVKEIAHQKMFVSKYDQKMFFSQKAF